MDFNAKVTGISKTVCDHFPHFPLNDKRLEFVKEFKYLSNMQT